VLGEDLSLFKFVLLAFALWRHSHMASAATATNVSDQVPSAHPDEEVSQEEEEVYITLTIKTPAGDQLDVNVRPSFLYQSTRNQIRSSMAEVGCEKDIIDNLMHSVPPFFLNFFFVFFLSFLGFFLGTFLTNNCLVFVV